jgi:hypothetical protein
MRSTVSGEVEVALHPSIDIRLSQRLWLAPAAGSRFSPRGLRGWRPPEILRLDQTGAAARSGQGRQGPVVPGVKPRSVWERREILIRTGWKVVSRALLASAVGGTGLLAGCGDSNKSDGQIQAAPEASNAAAAIAKSYGESMAKKYGNQMKKKP